MAVAVVVVGRRPVRRRRVNALSWVVVSKGRPRRAACIAPDCGTPKPVSRRVIRSALGCKPSPKRAFIWSSPTGEPCGTANRSRVCGSSGSRACGCGERV